MPLVLCYSDLCCETREGPATPKCKSDWLIKLIKHIFVTISSSLRSADDYVSCNSQITRKHLLNTSTSRHKFNQSHSQQFTPCSPKLSKCTYNDSELEFDSITRHLNSFVQRVQSQNAMTDRRIYRQTGRHLNLVHQILGKIRPTPKPCSLGKICKLRKHLHLLVIRLNNGTLKPNHRVDQELQCITLFSIIVKQYPKQATPTTVFNTLKNLILRAATFLALWFMKNNEATVKHEKVPTKKLPEFGRNHQRAQLHTVTYDLCL